MKPAKMAIIEVSVGIMMLLGILALVFMALRVSGLTTHQEVGSYKVQARFDNIGSLKVRAPVTISGVVVGRVADISFDSDTFEAVVTMNIQPNYKILPTDTSASILTSGLLGEQYIGLEPGADESVIQEGGQIEHTQSALVLEKLIGKFLTSKASGD